MPAGTVVASGSLISPGGQQGIAGPNAVSTDPGNLATFGSDNNIYIPDPTRGGLLSLVSATQLQFVPFRGGYIKINGLFYPIPTGGIAGLANTGVYVNGVAGQSLAASTFYRVYCFNNAGTLTADFVTTTGHSTSATPGNVGTEIKTGDDTRSLIGLVYTTSATPGQFVDTAGSRATRSWFNSPRITFYAATTAAITATSATAYQTAYATTFNGESVSITLSWYGTATVSTNVFFYIYVDGGSAAATAITTTGTTSKYENGAVAYAASPLSESFHSFQFWANCSAANTASGTGIITGTIG